MRTLQEIRDLGAELGMDPADAIPLFDVAPDPLPDDWVAFWRRVDRTAGPDGCWVWTGATRCGYGAIKIDGRVFGTHRLVASWYRGARVDDVVVDHLCGTRACVNPTHLDLVTHRTNCRRGSAPHHHLASDPVLQQAAA